VGGPFEVAICYLKIEIAEFPDDFDIFEVAICYLKNKAGD